MFTLIAYKPDSSCICMGCVTDVYSSDFQLHQCENLDALAAHVATIQQYEYGNQEAKYEVTILQHGRLLVSGESGTLHDDLRVKVEAILVERAEQARIAAEQQARLEVAARQAAQDKQHQHDLETFFALGKRLGYTITKN